MQHKQEIKQMDTKKLNTAIKKLKRKKSKGPDNIPNESFIEADQETRTIYQAILNKITKTETIPQEWQEGEMITMYKGKGIKGKCSNEIGIPLSSNFGNLYERIINERAKMTLGSQTHKQEEREKALPTDPKGTWEHSNKTEKKDLHGISRRHQSLRQSMVRSNHVCNA